MGTRGDPRDSAAGLCVDPTLTQPRRLPPNHTTQLGSYFSFITDATTKVEEQAKTLNTALAPGGFKV